MTITCVTILWATLVVTSAQENSRNPIIQNKNVNVIVNVNAQELAQELLKIINSRLNNCTHHTTSSNSIVKDLTEVVMPLVSPNRRSNIPSSVVQVASQLDKITRRALTRNTPSINMLDEEIMTRDIVADMMAFMKIFLSKQAKKDSSRRMHSPVATTMYDNKQNDYVNIRVKIHRKDILNAFN